MSSAIELHRKAMEEADNAFLEKKRGNEARALAFFKEALLLEKQAAFLARDQHIGQPTQAILFRSAAALAIHAQVFEDAKELIELGLTNHPPTEIVTELRGLEQDQSYRAYLRSHILDYKSANSVGVIQALMEAGAHFGHLRKKWNPKMLPYIFAEKKGVHIIDLNKTADNLMTAAYAMRTIARSGKKILFVGTKKQAKEIIGEYANKVNMPFVKERWLGGMLTNFNTIRKSVKKMESIEKMLNDTSIEIITKKERLVLGRDRDKMQRVLGGIAQLSRLPAALFIVDTGHENLAVAEARRLGITTFGIVDTNCDPNKIDFVIPANDDSTKSIELIVSYITAAIAEGLAERSTYNESSDTYEDDDHEAHPRKNADYAESESPESGRRSRTQRNRQRK